MKWHIIGSTSGIGYNAHVLAEKRDGEPASVYAERYGVMLGIGPGALLGFSDLYRVQVCESYSEAQNLRDAFCNACNSWRVVQERARVLASGIAILGGER